MTTNPPAVPLAGTVQTLMLAPETIAASPTNPRKTFPEQSLQELADSLSRDGQVQAILVRPLGVDGLLAWNKAHPGYDGDRPQYEIVSGERRWRAAQLAGLQLRAEVRELTDLQVVRIQIVENLHREEVHPLEEAEGYEFLLHKSGEQISIDQIADEVGKSRSYVYQRMKLAALCPDARKSFLAGQFDASTALLLARLPSAELQMRAIEDIKDMGDEDRTPSYRQIRAMLRDRYQLLLATAPFDIRDERLVPGCGSCTSCPKRTGNQPLLFEDVDSPDVCTDPDCFAGKRRARNENALAAARKKGVRIIEGDEAKEAVPHEGSPYLQGYTAVSDAIVHGGRDAITFADLLSKEGKRAPKPAILVLPGSGELVSVIDDETADRLRSKHWDERQRSQTQKAAREETPEQKEQREKRMAEARQHEIDRNYADLLYEALKEKAKAPRTEADLMLIIFAMAVDLQDELMEAAGLPSDIESADEAEQRLFERMKTMGPRGLATLALRAALTAHNLPVAALVAAAESHEVDTAQLLQQAIAKADEPEDQAA
jgi:ParB/RepB/Spo0J family partition protein